MSQRLMFAPFLVVVALAVAALFAGTLTAFASPWRTDCEGCAGQVDPHAWCRDCCGWPDSMCLFEFDICIC